MSGVATTRSARAMRARALAPRALFYAVVTILCLVGLRALFVPPAPAAPARVVERGQDLAVLSFAESFAHAYLTWDSDDEKRQGRLGAFLSDELDADGGLDPAAGSKQTVAWTSVLGTRTVGQRTIVTVTAQTSQQLVYLSVPVARSPRGFLSVVGYPALVGPPATEGELSPPEEDAVEDASLQNVIERALGNFLSGAESNLLADLAPDAVISLPAQRLRLRSVDELTWVEQDRRVAAQARVADQQGSQWTLRYEIDVAKHDRWYVRALAVDPTFKEDQR